MPLSSPRYCLPRTPRHCATALARRLGSWAVVGGLLAACLSALPIGYAAGPTPTIYRCRFALGLIGRQRISTNKRGRH